MDQISKHVTSSNHNIYYNDQMNKIIDNLNSKKCKNNNKSTFHINHLQNSLLMSIVDTPEKDV